MKKDKTHKDLKYRVFTMRLSEEVIKELKNRRVFVKSWNLLIKELLNKKK